MYVERGRLVIYAGRKTLKPEGRFLQLGGATVDIRLAGLIVCVTLTPKQPTPCRTSKRG
jgi:hypothetical protein